MHLNGAYAKATGSISMTLPEDIGKIPESLKKIRGYTYFATKGLLFNMKDDPEQRVNLYEKYPEKISEMDSLLLKYRETESSLSRAN
jgi:hypothetical protein